MNVFIGTDRFFLLFIDVNSCLQEEEEKDIRHTHQTPEPNKPARKTSVLYIVQSLN